MSTSFAYLIRTDSPIGRLELTSDGEAITSLSIERDGHLPLEEHPERSAPVLDEAARQLDEYFAGTRKDFDLPVRLAGTDFQRSVWEALGAARVRAVHVLRRARRRDRPAGVRSSDRRRRRGQSDSDHRRLPSRALLERPHHRLQRRRRHPDQALAAHPRGDHAGRMSATIIGDDGLRALFLGRQRCRVPALSR